MSLMMIIQYWKIQSERSFFINHFDSKLLNRTKATYTVKTIVLTGGRFGNDMNFILFSCQYVSLPYAEHTKIGHSK